MPTASTSVTFELRGLPAVKRLIAFVERFGAEWLHKLPELERDAARAAFDDLLREFETTETDDA